MNSVVACLRPSGSLEVREKQLEETMAQYNAVYTLLWKKDADGFFRVVNEYTTQARKRSHSSTSILGSSFLWPYYDIWFISDAHGTSQDFERIARRRQDLCWVFFPICKTKSIVTKELCLILHIAVHTCTSSEMGYYTGDTRDWCEPYRDCRPYRYQ